MGKSFLIVGSNLRKSKSQTVAIIALVLLTALLLNLWLMLSMDYHKNFDSYHDKLNAEHVTIAIDGGEQVKKVLAETLNNDEKVSSFRLDDCLFMVGTFPYNGGMMNSEFVFMEKQAALNRDLGKAEIVEEGDIKSGVYLPMLYKSEEIAVGKTIEISISSVPVEYTVCGFFNSVMMGSHNCTLTQILLTEDKYAELEESKLAFGAQLCSVRLKNPSENVDYEAYLKSFASEIFPNVRQVSNCYGTVYQSRYISQMICSGIMSAMAFFVLLISLVVIASNIINYIQVNMQYLGVLKAVGYTSRQLIFSLLLQFTGLTLIAALVGIGLSYALFPAVNEMMISQTGIPYAIRFLPLPLVISLLILCGSVTLAVYLSARRIKKIEPIIALRSGVKTHNFKKNHVPLQKTKAPLNVALALKTAFSGIKHNITVSVTMIVLSLVVVFSGLVSENIIADITPFLNFVVGETADSCINVNIEREEELLLAARADSRVEKIYLYNSVSVSHVDGAEFIATISDDFSDANNQSVIYKGRFPIYDNEIAIAAKYAKEEGFKVGDEIEMVTNGKREKYIISGLTQLTNNLGKDCLITRIGYERLGKLQNVSYYINLAEGTDVDRFNEEMQERFFGDVNIVINVQTTIEGAAGVYVTLMTIIVIAILVLSALIVTFVLYLLVRTMLNNKKRDYGILKALGFTSGQLAVQTALSFMPAIIISTAVGLVISCLVINPLMSLFMSSIGIVKCTFDIPIKFSIIAGFGLIFASFIIACLLSLKVKKIAPRELLVGE